MILLMILIDFTDFDEQALQNIMTISHFSRIFPVKRVFIISLSACDYIGERMASLFGLTSAKYQYAIDEYYRIKKEVGLFDTSDLATKATARVEVTYEVENEHQTSSRTIRVPAIVMATKRTFNTVI
uniref:Uncharacterized protein n=1 Tax=Gouania willdenowi TaxID=441366 RepID=A0A8C5N7H2_GOUWI